jgi:GST-like protein
MDVLNYRLGETEYLGGSEYSIADMVTWPWYGALSQGKLYEAGTFLDVASYKNLQRWTDQIAERPAVIRGRKVNRAFGPLKDQLRERHDASDFDKKTQDKIETAES